jgi:hypothetical protein
MNHLSDLKDAYPGYRDQQAKLTCCIDPEDAAFLRGFWPKKGLNQILLSIIVNDLIEEMRDLNIKSPTEENVRKFIELVRKRAPYQSFGPIERSTGIDERE